jgi:hypothetical protein
MISKEFPDNRVSGQPFPYPPAFEYVEPDWRRLPGYRDVTPEEWESAVWQRKHTIKNLKEFKAALGHHLPDSPGGEHSAGSRRAGHHVHAHSAPDAQHHERRAALGRPGASLHGARL